MRTIVTLMTQGIGKPLVPLEKIQAHVTHETALVILGFSIATYLLYKLFLRHANTERHRNLRRHFKNLFGHCFFGAAIYAIYFALLRGMELYVDHEETFARFASYVGLIVLIQGLVIVIKAARILVFEYLFLSHMKVAVPLLLINLFTLIFTVVLGGWLISDIFNIRLAPLMATSAVFSLILGLAIQDTLGNLFAGISLQIDKPYELGDWIEVHNGGQKWTGQVYEVSWRATVLLGYADELITISNRVVAQSQIATFATRLRPVARSQTYRLPYGVDTQAVKAALVASTRTLQGVRSDIQPQALVSETTESWITLKLFYYIDDFGQALTIADRVNENAMDTLSKVDVRLATQRLEVIQSREA